MKSETVDIVSEVRLSKVKAEAPAQENVVGED